MYAYDRNKLAKAKGIDYLVSGLVGQTSGAILAITGEINSSALGVMGCFLFVMGTGVLLGGCGMFARFHRLNRWTPFLGLLGIVGVSILLTLPTTVPRRGKYREGFGVMFAEPYRRDVWRMDVRVILDQSIGAAVREPIMLQLPRGANVGTALKTLAGVIPQLNLTQSPSERFTINAEPADRRSELSQGDELAIAATLTSSAHEQ